jgi:hypothetical protein
MYNNIVQIVYIESISMTMAMYNRTRQDEQSFQIVLHIDMHASA